MNKKQMKAEIERLNSVLKDERWDFNFLVIMFIIYFLMDIIALYYE